MRITIPRWAQFVLIPVVILVALYFVHLVSHAIFVCSDAEERCPRLWPTVSRLYWPTDNPAGASGNEDEQLDAFRRARDELHGRIKNWLMDLSESGKVPTSYSL